MDKKNKKVENEQEETLVNEEVNETEVKEEIKTEEVDEVAKLKKQADDYKDKWLRSVAEFDNYKKRNAKIWTDAFSEGAQSVITKILDIGDNLEWALSIGLDEKTAEGIKNLKKKYSDTLRDIGVTEINPVGEAFDPNIAEAVMQVEGEDGEQSETIKQVFQKGYKLNEKIIRYAKVSVIK